MTNQHMNTKLSIKQDTESREQIHTQSSSTEETYQCALCEQEFAPSQLVAISTEISDDSLCPYCADSLFDESEQDQINTQKELYDDDHAEGTHRLSDAILNSSAISENPTRNSHDNSDQSRRASAVSWAPPRVGENEGVLGAILSIHSLSLSLLWAIHRTNVRLIERFFDEVDIQTLTILWLALSTALLMVTTVT